MLILLGLVMDEALSVNVRTDLKTFVTDGGFIRPTVIARRVERSLKLLCLSSELIIDIHSFDLPDDFKLTLAVMGRFNTQLVYMEL